MLLATFFWLIIKDYLGAHILYYCPLCSNFTPFSKTKIIVTKSLDTSQYALTQFKFSFKDLTKFYVNPKFESMQNIVDVLPLNQMSLLEWIFSRTFLLGQRRVWFDKFCFLSVLSWPFMIAFTVVRPHWIYPRLRNPEHLKMQLYQQKHLSVKPKLFPRNHLVYSDNNVWQKN